LPDAGIEGLKSSEDQANWVPSYAKGTPLEIASRSGMDTGRKVLVNWLRAQGAQAEAK